MSICITTEMRCDRCGSHSSLDTETTIVETGNRTFVTLVRRQAKRAGWTQEGHVNKDYCPPCSEEREP